MGPGIPLICCEVLQILVVGTRLSGKRAALVVRISLPKRDDGQAHPLDVRTLRSLDGLIRRNLDGLTPVNRAGPTPVNRADLTLVSLVGLILHNLAAGLTLHNLEDPTRLSLRGHLGRMEL